MIKAKNKLGLVFFPAYDWAISPSHPEREERLLYTQDQLLEEGIEDIEGIEFFNPSIAKIEDIERVHFCVPNVKEIVPQPHLISAGGVIKSLQLVMDKEVDKAFALTRPPGHHAQRVVYGDRGFCIINTEAVAIEKIRQDYGNLRVAIIDSDCHHGDGTQDIYWNDKNTLFISFHQDGRTLFPGTGFTNEFGGPGGYGYNINIPLLTETGDDGILYVMENLVMPILDDYKPDLIINSAGQDNHYLDPLTSMNFTARGYAKLSQMLNPDVAVLEGGYSIEGSLPYINLGIILAMAGIDYSRIREPDYDKESIREPQDIKEYTKKLCEKTYNLWKSKGDVFNKSIKGKDYIGENKRFYYDTVGISEKQFRKFKVCNKCSGLNTIDSTSSNHYHILAITVPKDACSNCLSEGHKLYKDTSIKYTNVYLQDRVNDRYYSK